MGYIVAFLLLSSGILLQKVRRTWAAPDVFYCYLWGFICLFASLRLFSMYSVSEKAWILILVGSLAFLTGVFLTNKVKIKNCKYISRPLVSVEFYEESAFLKKRSFWILYTALLIFALINFRVTLQSLSAGYSLDDVRLAGYGLSQVNGYVIRTGYIWELFYSVRAVAEMLVVATGIQYFIMDMKKNYTCIVAVLILTLLGSFSNGGRFALVYMLIELLACLSIYKKCGKRIGFVLSVKTKRRIKQIVFVLVCAVLSITLMRGSEMSDLLKKIYRYFCGNVVFFDKHIQQIDSANIWTFVFSGLYGLWVKILPLLNSVGLSYPETYLTAVTEVVDVQTFVKIGDEMYTNAFVTPFYALYADLRWGGVILGMFILGIIAGSAYKKVKHNINGTTVVVYLVIIQMLFKTLQMYPLTNTDYALFFIVLIIIRFFPQKHRKYG